MVDYFVWSSGDFKPGPCEICGDPNGITYNEDGQVLCEDCLFEEQIEESLKN